MKNTSRKLGRFVLAGAIAFGGLGIGAVADIPIPGIQAQKVDAAMLYGNIFSYSNTKNTLNHSYNFVVDSDVAHFGRTANWYVKDMGANVKLRGTSTVEFKIPGSPGRTGWETKNVRTDLSSLSTGTYELLYIYNAGGIEYRVPIFFYKNADGSIDTH